MAKNKMDGPAAALQVSGDSRPSEMNPSSSDLSDEWRDWSGLPEHLLSDIAGDITDLDDFVSFGRVCTSWQTVFLHNIKSLGSPLLLIDSPDEKDYDNHRALYSLSNKSIWHVKVPLPCNKHCRGSSFGWLITMEVKGYDCYHVQLQNPFLSRTINLPPLDNIVQLHPDEHGKWLSSGRYLWKATMSSDPCTSDDFIVMASVSRYNGLAYFKPGNDCWVPIGDRWSLESDTRFEDVIFYHKARQFYGIRLCGTLLAVRFCGDKQDPEVVQVAPPMDACLLFGTGNMHLIEDLESGDLLLVLRKHRLTEKNGKAKRHSVHNFLVYKLNPLEQSWRQIHDLGSKVLFVGPTCSALRSASDCPGCLPNCIYFTCPRSMGRLNPKKYYRAVVDGMYRLEDGSVQEYYYSGNAYSKTPSETIWLEPTALPLTKSVSLDGRLCPEASLIV